MDRYTVLIESIPGLYRFSALFFAWNYLLGRGLPSNRARPFNTGLESAPSSSFSSLPHSKGKACLYSPSPHASAGRGSVIYPPINYADIMPLHASAQSSSYRGPLCVCVYCVDGLPPTLNNFHFHTRCLLSLCCFGTASDSCGGISNLSPNRQTNTHVWPEFILRSVVVVILSFPGQLCSFWAASSSFDLPSPFLVLILPPSRTEQCFTVTQTHTHIQQQRSFFTQRTHTKRKPFPCERARAAMTQV